MPNAAIPAVPMTMDEEENMQGQRNIPMTMDEEEFSRLHVIGLVLPQQSPPLLLRRAHDSSCVNAK